VTWEQDGGGGEGGESLVEALDGDLVVRGIGTATDRTREERVTGDQDRLSEADDVETECGSGVA
jgi:hypothetical protein